MDKQKLNRVIKLAGIARKRCLRLERVLGFKDGNPITISWFESTLKDACGLVSWYTIYLANCEKLYPTFVKGDYGIHCWVEYYNHIIDASAQQFNKNKPAVYTESKQKIKLDSFYHTNARRIARNHSIAKALIIKNYSDCFYSELLRMNDSYD